MQEKNTSNITNTDNELNQNNKPNQNNNPSTTKKKISILNIVGIALSVPGIINSLFIYVPVLLSITKIYEGDPYFILFFTLFASILFPVTLVAFIVWAICVHVKKVRQGVPLREYKIAYIFWAVDFGLFAILVVPFALNFISNLFL